MHMPITPGLEYAFCALVLFGSGDVIYKRGIAAGTPPHQYMAVQSWFFLSTVLVYGVITRTLTFVPGMLWGCLTGLFMWAGFYNFALSLRTGSISVNAPIFRLSFVITAVLAILVLGEPLTIGKAAGAALAFIAIWLLMGGSPGAVTDRRASRSSLTRVLIATVAVGLGNLIYKYGFRAGATPATMVAAQAVVVVSTSTLFSVVTDRGMRLATGSFRYAPITGVMFGTGFAFLVESLARGEASRMVPIAQMGLAVTAVVGFLFLRETFTARKGVGLAASVAALACFAW
jgi:uncharacterized membrane protein